MCGPYIHGRSWWDENIKKWLHFCEPYKINAHAEMPSLESVLMDLSCMAETYDIIKTRDLLREAIPSLSGTATRFHLTKSGSECFLGSKRQIVDWGITPWSGKLTLQRGDKYAWDQSGVCDDITKKNFLPHTRHDLIEWAKNHWGKHQDGSEFISKMPECLDIWKLWPELPTSAKVATGFPERKAVSNTLQLVNNPCDRWAEMFKEAPNEFWMAKN